MIFHRQNIQLNAHCHRSKSNIKLAYVGQNSAVQGFLLVLWSKGHLSYCALYFLLHFKVLESKARGKTERVRETENLHVLISLNSAGIFLKYFNNRVQIIWLFFFFGQMLVKSRSHCPRKRLGHLSDLINYGCPSLPEFPFIMNH